MLKYFSSRIGRKILWIFILISTSSIIIISGLSIFQLKTVFTRKSSADYEKIAEELYYNINRLIIKGKTDISVITRNPVITSSRSTPDEKLSELQKLQKTFKIYEDITLIDPSGLVVASTHYSYRGDWRYKRHFLESLKGNTLVSNVQAIRSPEKYIIDFSSPVYDEKGRLSSVVAAQLDMQTMSDIITHVKIDETGHAFLLNGHHKIIAHRETDRIFLKPPMELIEQIKNHSRILQFRDAKGQNLVGACFDPSKLPSDIRRHDDTIDWIVVIVQNEKEMFRPLTDMIWKIGVYSLIICGVVVILAILFSRTITGPIKTLTEGAEILGGGDLGHRVTVGTRDELQQLARSFNLMAEKLHQLQSYLASIIDSMPSVLIGVNVHGRITLWNSEASRSTGLSSEDALGRPLAEAFPRLGPEMDLVRDAVKTREVRLATRKAHPTDHEIRYEDITIYPLADEEDEGVVIRVDDVTEKVRLEKMVIQNEKMQSVGVLAAGIAHDFNNILAAIMGYTELARLTSSNSPTTLNYLDQLLLASKRAKELVQQILEFSRKSNAEKRPVDIGAIIKETLKLLRASIPSTIEIERNVESNMGAVEADPTQIHQIVMNLCTNAFHAMGREGGRLSVDLTPVDIGPESLAAHPDLKPGPYLRLTVNDTGHGMDPATASRIFEPYFTTKKTGEGTGMGLATVHGIVKNHGGDIRVYSRPGAGTTFHVLLPMAEGRTEKPPESPNVFQEGHERILLVDDEEFLVDIGRSMLTRLGYRVDSRTSSPDALTAFKSRPDQYDLIITDMTMPKMTGATLSTEIRKIRPDIPIIVCTGYSSELTSENPEDIGVNRILLKPLNLAELSQAVRQVLDHPAFPGQNEAKIL